MLLDGERLWRVATTEPTPLAPRTKGWEAIIRVEEVDFDPFADGEISVTGQCTAAQREIFAAAALGDGASCAFNESVRLRLDGALDVAVLTNALRDLVARHESLRMTFSNDGRTFVVARSIAVKCPVVSLASVEDLEAIVTDEVSTPFDLVSGPLVRFVLARLDTSSHVLVITAHHIVCDGWSFGVLVRDLACLYKAHVSGQSHEAPAARFSDFAQAEEIYASTPEYAEDERYWVAKFSQLPEALELPLDRPRPNERTYASARLDYALPSDAVDAARKLGAAEHASLFTTMLAAFSALVHRLSGNEDVVVLIPSAGQATSGFSELVGHCVSALPIRLAVRSADAMSDLLKRTRSAMLDAIEHRHLTYGALVQKLGGQREPSRKPLVSVVFNLEQTVESERIGMGPVRTTFSSNARRFESFDLFVNASELRGAVTLEVQYATEMLDAPTVRTWLDAYVELLRCWAGDHHRAVGRVALGAVHRNVHSVRQRPRVTAHSLVFEQARRTPDAVAIEQGTERVTYMQLARQARAVAEALARVGVTPGAAVAVHLERTPRLPIALLAVLEAGGCYVALDATVPPERLRFMIDDVGARVVVTETSLAGTFGDSSLVSIAIDKILAALPATADEVTSMSLGDPESVAFVVYTSGSTGKPKGVSLTHQGLVNCLLGMRETLDVSESDTVLGTATLAFDMGTADVFLPLIVGARLVIATDEQGSDGQALAELIEAHDVSFMQATPSRWRLVVGSRWRGSGKLKAVAGGEVLTAELAEAINAKSCALWNGYGPTETSIYATFSRVPRGETRIGLGEPIPNTSLFVVDRYDEPVLPGVIGELCIGGLGVARGYINRPERNAARFGMLGGERIYRSGDLVRWHANGFLEFVGRADTQVKLRGFRVELAEIETALRTHVAIADVAVSTYARAEHDTQLVAYVVGRPDVSWSESELRKHVRAILPSYMVPHAFKRLDALPFTTSGKVDRKLLPVPEPDTAVSGHVAEVAQTPTEKAVASAYSEALGGLPVGLHDNFFDLGGHSLACVKVVATIEKATGKRLSARLVLRDSVQQVAAYLDASPSPVDESPRPSLSERIYSRLFKR